MCSQEFVRLLARDSTPFHIKDREHRALSFAAYVSNTKLKFFKETYNQQHSVISPMSKCE